MNEEKENIPRDSQGCLIVCILIMAVVLFLLGKLCFIKANLVLHPPVSNTATADQATQPVMAEPYLVVIDPGHQAKGNKEKEPIGPGAQEQKAKVTSGAEGVATGQEEYELNLQVALKLRQELEDRGYRVELTRTTHEVDMSNIQRAEMANNLEADVFIRIHANADEDSTVSGVMTLCQTPEDPFGTGRYYESRALAQFVLEATAQATGATMQPILETDTMAGINWCQVPVTIVEMGYLSNPAEDKLLLTEDYQQKLAQGIATGIDHYFQDS